MPTMITDECVNCGACLSICPNDGISRGEYKVELDALLNEGTQPRSKDFAKSTLAGTVTRVKRKSAR